MHEYSIGNAFAGGPQDRKRITQLSSSLFILQVTNPGTKDVKT